MFCYFVPSFDFPFGWNECRLQQYPEVWVSYSQRSISHSIYYYTVKFMRINIPSRRNITTSKFWSQETSVANFYRFSVETFQTSSIFWFGEKLNQKNSVRNGFDSSFCVSTKNVSKMFRLVWTFRSQGKQVRNKNQTVTNWKIHFQPHWRERKKQR